MRKLLCKCSLDEFFPQDGAPERCASCGHYRVAHEFRRGKVLAACDVDLAPEINARTWAFWSGRDTGALTLIGEKWFEKVGEGAMVREVPDLETPDGMVWLLARIIARGGEISFEGWRGGHDIPQFAFAVTVPDGMRTTTASSENPASACYVAAARAAGEDFARPRAGFTDASRSG